MRKPIYKRGQLLIDNSTGREVNVKYPNVQRKLVTGRTNRVTGFEDEFTGTYFCSWLTDKGKVETGDISEELLIKP